VRSFAISNDVELVQATLSGNVWVGYGDDGAYGDNPLSQTGVVCFDQNGKVIFRFNKLANQEQALKIEHTYAMNVISDNEAWLYYYTQPPENLASLYSDTEFALARVRNQEVDKVWRDITNRAPVRGEHAVAVHDHRLLFGGKSLVDQSSIYLVSLSDDSFQRYIAAADGEPIESWLGFARGSWLYLWTDNALYGIDASTLPPLD
jgi:hypothetical protein